MVTYFYQPTDYSQQRQREKKVQIYPIRMAMEATHRWNQGYGMCWDVPIPDNLKKGDKVIREAEGLPFLELPHADRLLTNARNPKWQNNGNFKYRPGTYIMSASGCWHGKCTFCVEKGKKYEVREVDDVIAEIKECEQMGFREIFDDSATFPTGEWLEEFCHKLKPIDVKFSCNMRCVPAPYELMKEAGFRMLLFGVESANQKTLDKICKGRKEQDIKHVIEASLAGLQPHLAVMFGYPWETEKDALKTLKLTQYMLRKGWAMTAQASLYTPPDGKNNPEHKKYVPKIYHAGFYPDFWWNRIKRIRTKEDIEYLWRGIKKGLTEGA